MEAGICGSWSEGRPTPSPEHNGCHNDGGGADCACSVSVLKRFIKAQPLSPVVQVTPTKPTKKSSAAPDATKDQVTTRSPPAGPSEPHLFHVSFKIFLEDKSSPKFSS